MKNILILLCLIQVCIQYNCFTQTKVTRGTTEEVSDSLIVKVYPKNVPKFRSNSALFFSKEKRLDGLSKDKFGTILSFYVYLDSNGRFVKSNTSILTKIKKKVVLDYINTVIRKTYWNLDTSLLLSHDTKTYILGINVYVKNNKKIKIGVIPSTNFPSIEYYIF